MRVVEATNTETRAVRVTKLHDKIAQEMPPLSHLECMSCGHRQQIGDVAGKLRNGWPTCCNGHAMRLFTVREVEAARGSVDV